MISVSLLGLRTLSILILFADKLQVKNLLFFCVLGEIVPPQMKTHFPNRLQDALIIFKRSLKTPAGSTPM